MNRFGSIGVRTVQLTLTAVCFLVVVAVTGWTAVSGLASGIDRMDTAQTAQQDQGVLDASNYAMLYDALTLATSTDGVLAIRSGGPAAVKAAVVALVAAQQKFDTSFDADTAQIDEFTKAARAQAAADAARARWLLGVAVLVGAVVLAGIGWFIRRGINQVASAMLQPVLAAVRGDLTQPVTVHGPDPLGQTGEELSRLFTDLRSNFGEVARSADQLGSAATGLIGLSEQLASDARAGSAQADDVSSAAEQVSTSVADAAAGTQLISSSTGQIAEAAGDVGKAIAGASASAAATNAVITRLADSSAQIGQVADLIASIAEQTNLLALNATIEAARAGEAGKGFAVVANEVKELAGQTATATEEIGRRIAAIQADTGAAVSTVADLFATTEQVAVTQASIARLVDEQSATTATVGHSVSQAATGSAEIAGNIASLARVSEQTANRATQYQRAGRDVSDLANHLTGLVARFTH